MEFAPNYFDESHYAILDKSLAYGGLHADPQDGFPPLLHNYSSGDSLSLSGDYAIAGSYMADLPLDHEAVQWDMQALLDLDGEELLVADHGTAGGLLQDSTTDSAAGLRCPHPSCSSKTVFMRQCDVDKHYRLHFRQYLCRIEGCQQKQGLAFATVKDRDRHERAHNPSIPCQHCGKLFSRQDNLRDHCRRRHGKGK